MRHLKRIWRSLESIPGLAEIPAEWKVHCGTDYPFLAPFLRPTETIGRRHPCPHPRDADCPRAIVEYGDGSLAAVCQHPHRRCEDLPLPITEALVHRLDLAGLIRAIAQPLAVRAQQPEAVAPGVWAVGTSISSASRNQPAFLAAHVRHGDMRSAAQLLAGSRPLPFVFITPTNRFVTSAISDLLQVRNSSLVVLEDRVGISDEGSFVALEPSGGESIVATDVEKRPAVVDDYKRIYDTTDEAIFETARVDKSDFYKWIAGKIKNTSVKAKRIEEVLRTSPRRARHS